MTNEIGLDTIIETGLYGKDLTYMKSEDIIKRLYSLNKIKGFSFNVNDSEAKLVVDKDKKKIIYSIVAIEKDTGVAYLNFLDIDKEFRSLMLILNNRVLSNEMSDYGNVHKKVVNEINNALGGKNEKYE